MPLQNSKLTLVLVLIAGSLSVQAATFDRVVELTADKNPAEWLDENGVTDI